MINSLNIFSSSKTDQIMSRYRPIAPKPQLPPQNPSMETQSPHAKNQQSPFLSPTSSRITRQRKRNRSSNSFYPHKKTRTHFIEDTENTHLGLSLQGFAHGFPKFSFPPGPTMLHDNLENPTKRAADFGTHSLLPCSCYVPSLTRSMATNNQSDFRGTNLLVQTESKNLDLNSNPEIPTEKDLLHKLQAPFSSGFCNVIMPQPVRPVGSTIRVESIHENAAGTSSVARAPKRPEEVEEEVESEVLPAIISDSNNKVKLANSAYKEMVGQPECLWLGVTESARPKRINGEVMLDLSLDTAVPVSSKGFSCSAKIEWTNNGDKIFINAPCDVVRLYCESKDYLFTWKFHTREASSDTKNNYSFY